MLGGFKIIEAAEARQAKRRESDLTDGAAGERAGASEQRTEDQAALPPQCHHPSQSNSMNALA
jgi:hypothetical protein